MNPKNEIGAAFQRLGRHLKELAQASDTGSEELFDKIRHKNPWFTEANVRHSLATISKWLGKEELDNWLSRYPEIRSLSRVPKKVGVINAGNIPLVGFHDFMSVLISGNIYVGKNSSDDPYLLPFISGKLIGEESSLREKIHFADKLTEFDAVIATGSNNSSRYFEYYFRKVPHIIRRNMNGVGVLTGSETKEQLQALGSDIFTYFGMGCRNVSKIYVPQDYEFTNFFESIYDFKEVMQHSKYMNNFDHANAILLLKRVPFLQNGFLIVLENPLIASPLAVLHYERYSDIEKFKKSLVESQNLIQCIVTGSNELKAIPELEKMVVDFGKTQEPHLWDYADRVDTMEFLLSRI